MSISRVKEKSTTHTQSTTRAVRVQVRANDSKVRSVKNRLNAFGFVLCAMVHAGCGSAPRPTTSRIRVDSQRTSPLSAEAAITDPEGCPTIDPALLARARPMALENPGQIARGLGLLILHTSYPERSTTTGFGSLELGRFDPLSEAAAAEVERDEGGASDIEVWLDDADGSSRAANVEQSMNSNDNEMYSYTIRAVLRPTTRAIRVMSKDRLIERLERPQVPPAVEALVLRDWPPLIAVRVRGVTSAMVLALREDLEGEPIAMAFLNNLTGVNSRGVYPCWVIIPEARDAEGDQGAALRLTLLDVFHLWRFHHAR